MALRSSVLSLPSHILGGGMHPRKVLSRQTELLRCCSHYRSNGEKVYRTKPDQRQSAEDRVKGMGRSSFWDEYYRERTPSKGSFDWFLQYDSLQSTLADIISKISLKAKYGALTAMDIGCGTSSLAHRVTQEYGGRLNVCCVDFSGVALNKLQGSERNCKAHGHLLSNVEYVAADGFNLPFRDATFDLIFEKGTLDSVLKTPEFSQRANEFVLEILRLLTRDGVYCQFSDEDPDLRLPLLEGAKRALREEQLREVSVGFKEIVSDAPLPFFCITLIGGLDAHAE